MNAYSRPAAFPHYCQTPANHPTPRVGGLHRKRERKRERERERGGGGGEGWRHERENGFGKMVEKVREEKMKRHVITAKVNTVINPRHTCAARVTVVVSCVCVCVCVCLYICMSVRTRYSGSMHI